MKRFLLIISVLFASVTNIWGADNLKSLVIKFTNGESATYLLNTKPKLTVVGTSLLISSDTYEVSHSLSDIQCYYHEESGNTDIINPSIVPESLVQRDEMLVISGLAVGKIVNIYSVSGSLMLTQRVDKAGKTFISLTDLPKGVYVVKYGNSVTKIMKQ